VWLKASRGTVRARPLAVNSSSVIYAADHDSWSTIGDVWPHRAGQLLQALGDAF